jgi:DNA-binding response OmpR family regulator
MKAKKSQPSDPNRTSILVVEDETDLQDLLCYSLGREGFAVSAAGSGEEALKLAQSHKPDLILLDLMLPGMDGLTVFRTLRSIEGTSQIPIVMLTAKGEEADIVVGLELGADDYITKPFSPRVLLARIQAVLRRKGQGGAVDPEAVERIERGALVIDIHRHIVTINGQAAALTITEFKLLMLLVSHTQRVFSRQQIIEAVHGPNALVSDRSVDTQIVGLRKKLGATGKQIATVRGVGYRFTDQE